ncbi:hypothetical protein GCM10009678_24900 [Actinomadura kijaniata]|uniref:LCP family protein required for cell wall assembly n=1 Tax=Actinomadura namibiensis TaxID=182080 RepID=A0A7W3LPG2_ACTNM|nr:LCP family protein [Actinomadura namibiensis]MBA8951780.1 LCP family protein required for cell wall assembly [Actinomadura namibiensis]
MKRVLVWASVATAAVTVTGSLSAYGYYWRLQSSIRQEDTDRLIGGNRPPKLNDALNVLVLGSDTRKGANARYGRGHQHEAPKSDTMILMHLSPGGGQVLGVSFPRDLLVPIPPCARPDGTVVPGAPQAMLNEAIGRAGPSCTIKTIEKLAGIHIDHFVQVDFTGFKEITTAIGGVPICLPKDVRDKDSGFRKPKGTHRVQGEEALAYFRLRKNIGDNSDTQRIKRQQMFLGAMAKQATSTGVLADPGRLNGLLTSVARSLTTDKGLRLTNMLRIAQSLQGIDPGRIRFMTVPSGPWARDPDRIVLSDGAQPFFTALRNDTTVPEPVKAAAIPARVRVLNGSGVQGRARVVGDQLAERKYTVTKVGNLAAPTARTVIRHAPADAAAARALAALIPGAATRPGARSVPGVLDLVIGANFTRVKGGGIPRQQGEHRATDDICGPTKT